MMYTDEELEQLEQEEREITEEEIALMLLLLSSTRKDLTAAIREFYQQYGKDGVVTYAEARKWISDKDHRRRLTVLLLFISQSFDDLLNNLKPHFEKLIEDIWDKEFEFFGAELLDEIDAPKWGADDKNWEERLEDDITTWNYNTQTKVKQGLLRQDNLEDVLKDVNKVLDYANRAISVLALTESTAIGSTAREEVFIQRGFKKYRFYTQADERTCEICGSMHGLVFPVSAMKVGVNASPLHPNCRCFEIPVE